MRMSPKLARKIHEMRKEHIPYRLIRKQLGISSTRGSMQHYYYKWCKETKNKPWGVE